MHGVLGNCQHDDLYRADPETLSLEELRHEARPLESSVAAHDKQQCGTVLVPSKRRTSSKVH